METAGDAPSDCRPSILDLPAEIRLKIYRFLLINPRTIGDSRYNPEMKGHRQFWDWDQFSMDWRGPRSGKHPDFSWKRWDPREDKENEEYPRNPGSSTCRLSGQLLATCQLIYRESSAVLYGENTFGLHVFVRDAYEDLVIESSFFEGHDLDELSPPWPAKSLSPRGFDKRTFSVTYQFAVDKIQRLRLVVDLDYSDEPIDSHQFNHLQHALGKISHRLSRVQLQYLNIDLRSRHPMTRFCMLEPLMVLRGLCKVTFNREPENPNDDYRECGSWRPNPPLTELPRRFKRHLKKLLESDTPVDDLFMENHNYQRVLTYLALHQTPQSVFAQLGSLVKEPRDLSCYDGPYEACEHWGADKEDCRSAKLNEDRVSESEGDVESTSDEPKSKGKVEVPN